jgi:transposase, IS30 family
MGTYRRITNEDRLQIKTFLDMDLCASEIAIKLKFHKSSIGREIARNSGGRGYRYKQACGLSLDRQGYRSKQRKMTDGLAKVIEEKLMLRWSPEQISNRLKLEEKPSVCTETIYRYIYKDSKNGGQLWRQLRRSRRKRYRRFPHEERRGSIQNARPIAERPKQANKRKKCGHWERDTMIGLDRKTAILVCTDRKSRYNKLKKLKRRKAVNVTKKTIEALCGLPLKSITNDRGQEFNDSKRLEKKIGVNVYYCDPYSSYQRGTNENRIGILRDYLPKKTDLTKVSTKEIEKIEFEINNRPMKCLDWKSPYEVLFKKSCTAFV